MDTTRWIIGILSARQRRVDSFQEIVGFFNRRMRVDKDAFGMPGSSAGLNSADCL
jgi:hypothetical protein